MTKTEIGTAAEEKVIETGGTTIAHTTDHTMTDHGMKVGHMVVETGEEIDVEMGEATDVEMDAATEAVLGVAMRGQRAWLAQEDLEEGSIVATTAELRISTPLELGGGRLSASDGRQRQAVCLPQGYMSRV